MSSGESAVLPSSSSAAPILVAEDDAALRETICAALQERGLAVETAGDGWSALVSAARVRPALVVLDWRLPCLSGAEVAAGLRAAFGHRLPILLMSGYQGLARDAWRARAAACLYKPFDLDELVVAVELALARASAGRR